MLRIRNTPIDVDQLRRQVSAHIDQLHQIEQQITQTATGRNGLPIAGDTHTYLTAVSAIARGRNQLALYAESLR